MLTLTHSRNNFSHNNSVLQDHSQFNVVMIQDSSSEFNFESPLATGRGAQEVEFKGIFEGFWKFLKS